MDTEQLIVIDGADAAGKKTQTRLLADALREEGRAVATFDFPRYEESAFGKLLRRALAGEFGSFGEVSPYLSSWLYTLDRVSARDALIKALSRSVVLCDRYVPSNIAYQAAKLPEKEQDEFIRLLEEAEYGELGIPRPRLVVYLSVPVEVSQRLMKTEGRTLDVHEADLEYQRRVNSVYRRLAGERPDWTVIECAPDGRLLSKDEIHRKVYDVIAQRRRRFPKAGAPDPRDEHTN